MKSLGVIRDLLSTDDNDLFSEIVNKMQLASIPVC